MGPCACGPTEAALRLVAVAAAVAAVLSEVSSSGPPRSPSGPRLAALLVAPVTVDALLRLVPSRGGASPIFGLILLAGGALGPTLGFLKGSLTPLPSAAVTDGFGPYSTS